MLISSFKHQAPGLYFPILVGNLPVYLHVSGSSLRICKTQINLLSSVDHHDEWDPHSDQQGWK